MRLSRGAAVIALADDAGMLYYAHTNPGTASTRTRFLMGVRLCCPDCGFSLDGSTSGDRPPCAGCRQRALLAINARRRDDDEEEDDDRPRKKKRPAAEDDEEDDDRPRKTKPIARDDDEDDDRPRKKKRPVAEDDDEDDDRPRRKKRPRDEDDDEEEEEVKQRKKAKVSSRDKDDEEEEDEEDERKPIKPGSRRDKMSKVKGGVISFSVAIYILLAIFVDKGLIGIAGLVGAVVVAVMMFDRRRWRLAADDEAMPE